MALVENECEKCGFAFTNKDLENGHTCKRNYINEAGKGFVPLAHTPPTTPEVSPIKKVDESFGNRESDLDEPETPKKAPKKKPGPKAG